MVRLYEITGRILQEIRVSGDKAIFEINRPVTQVYIVRAYTSEGTVRSVKFAR
jgi:hypothetical protein